MALIDVITQAPIEICIEVQDDNDRLCGYDCEHWDTELIEGKDKNRAYCLFGRLRWKDDEFTYRHKKCLEAKQVRRRKKE